MKSLNQKIACLILISLFSSPLLARDSAIIVFDASGSMWGKMEGKTKIEIARDVMGTVIKDWNQDIALGLMAYGHREKGDCNDIEVLMPVGKPDGEKVLQLVGKLIPKGKTPLSESLKQAAETLRYVEDPATVILISDGEETCNADPCEVSKELEEKGINFTAHVIGFDVRNNPKARKQLQCIAENTGGQFYEAENAAALHEALLAVKEEVQQKVQRKQRVSGVVFKAMDSSSPEQPVSDSTEWTIINDSNEEIRNLKSDSGELQTDLATGDYEIFVTAGNRTGETKVTVSDAKGQQFNITLQEKESDKPFDLGESVVAGEVLRFNWRGPNNNGDMIFIFEPGEENNRYPLNDERRHLTSKGQPAVLTAPAKPGKYEVRYYSYDNGSVLSRIGIEVTPSQLEMEFPNTVPAGEKFSLSWENSPGSPEDMIFVSTPEMEDNRYYYDNRLLAEKASSGSLIAPAEPGSYEVRYYSNNNGTVLKRFPLTVTEPNVTLKADRVGKVGTRLEVEWTGPNLPGDLIFIAEPDLDENRYYMPGGKSASTASGSPVTLTAPADAGTYEIRYFSKSSGGVLAKRALIVR
jgi:Ca-activated chloride channel family protein